MGTNFYIKKSAKNEEILQNEVLLFFQGKLNAMNPRERQGYIEDTFDLISVYDYGTKWQNGASTWNYSRELTEKIMQSHFEYMEKHHLKVVKLCCKEELTLDDMSVIKELIEKLLEDESLYHIGKRSAAGHYCKKCNMPLALGGMTNLHGDGRHWDKCPICKTKQEDLGFVCSFTWQWGKKYWKNVFEKHPELIIVDEYDDEYTIENFLKEEIESCVPFNLQRDELKWFS